MTETPPQLAGVLDAVLSTARALLQCELVAVNVLSGDAIVTARAAGHLPGLSPGVRARRTDTLCHLLLAGAEPAALDLAVEPAFAAAPAVADLALRTYVGVPVQDADQRVVGTLCGFDRRLLEVDDRKLEVLQGLAAVLTPYAGMLATADASIVRRDGSWLVQGVDPAGTGTALAALLGDPGVPPVRERDWLLANVELLEAATQRRVAVEQAVGRVSERLGVPPLNAFRALQREARDRTGSVDADGLRAAEHSGAPHRLSGPAAGEAAGSRR